MALFETRISENIENLNKQIILNPNSILTIFSGSVRLILRKVRFSLSNKPEPEPKKKHCL